MSMRRDLVIDHGVVRANCDDRSCYYHERHGQPGDEPQPERCWLYLPRYNPPVGERVSDYCARFEPCDDCPLCRPACDAPR
jgi:hypothetical protein